MSAVVVDMTDAEVDLLVQKITAALRADGLEGDQLRRAVSEATLNEIERLSELQEEALSLVEAFARRMIKRYLAAGISEATIISELGQDMSSLGLYWRGAWRKHKLSVAGHGLH